ncbi:flippase [Olivibacter sp. LS-1]|uniref:flippase n=1 Tax=Olivibacter sp. LS-1 TaxID=2592345 RepID=UPI0011EAF8F0|nr:flippase [Olivibacter sp. LS-1]QEL00352.1 flippase [Olivibacter sp. LS-1]
MGTIKKNAFYNILLSISQILFPLITFPYISRVLGPVGIGNVSFVDSVTQYFILAAALGIPIYGVREIAKSKGNPEKRSQVFSELLIIHLSTTALAVSLYVGIFFTSSHFEVYRPLFYLGAGALFFQSLAIEWLFQGLEEFPYITKRTLVVRAFSILAIFLLVNKPGDEVWYYGISCISVLINVLFNITYAKRFVHLRRSRNIFKKHGKALLYIFSLGLVTSVYTVLDTALLGFLSTPAQVGYYATSARLIKLVVMIFVAFSTVLIPPLSKAFHEANEQSANLLLEKSFGYTILLSVPASIGLYIVAPMVIKLYAGSQFIEAVKSLQILAPSILFISLSNVFGMQILNPTNNERLFFKAAIIGMLISLLINFSLIPFLGQVGAALSSVITEFSVLALLIFYALRKVNFRPAWKLLWQALLASLPVVVVCPLIVVNISSVPLQLVLIISVAILVYGGIQRFAFHNPHLSALLEMLQAKLGKAKNSLKR